MTIAEFLRQVETIVKLNPSYALGHTGADGECDCIGLIIGAVERNGVSWIGIHGSNWWARIYTEGLRPIAGAASLALGELVYKAKEPGANGYNLPSRYAKDADQRDYYHVGVVTAVNPLQITHCTSGGGADGIVRDTRVGNWTHHGALTLLSDKEVTPTSKTATVTSPNGKPVNLRRAASSSGALVDRIPVGTMVTVLEAGAEWSKISTGDRTGYMMSAFLSGWDEQPAGLEQRVEELTRTVAELVARVEALEGAG